jgi:serine/threonine protein kinase
MLDLGPDTAPFAEGTVVDGRYRILTRLSEGGMGTVYLAHQINLDRQVAIKVIRRDVSMLVELRQRFVREATALARASHDHIVTVHDHGQLPSGELYIVMEYLEGFALQYVVDMEGPLAFERVLRIGLQIARALRMAHSVDVLHRDLKPANVMVLPSLDSEQPERVKLLDFGLAKILDSHGSDGNITMSPSLMGSPYYMSPEQICGDPVGPGADIYALGCVLYYMATGVPVFEGERHSEIVVRHLNEAPAPASMVGYQRWCPPMLEVLLFRCLQKSPEERYASMQDVVDALKDVLDSLGQLRQRDDSHLDALGPLDAPLDDDPTQEGRGAWSPGEVPTLSPVPFEPPVDGRRALGSLPPMPPPQGEGLSSLRPPRRESLSSLTPARRSAEAPRASLTDAASPVLAHAVDVRPRSAAPPAIEPTRAASLASLERNDSAERTSPSAAPLIPAARVLRAPSGELTERELTTPRALALDLPPSRPRALYAGLGFVLLAGPLVAWAALRTTEPERLPAAVAEAAAPAPAVPAAPASPAVVPPPPPPPVEAAPVAAAEVPTQQVVVSFVSRPTGAKVYDGDTLLGVTPMRREFEVRGSGELHELVFERDGYARQVVRTPIDTRTQTISGVLQPLPGTGSLPRARPRPSVPSVPSVPSARTSRPRRRARRPGRRGLRRAPARRRCPSRPCLCSMTMRSVWTDLLWEDR